MRKSIKEEFTNDRQINFCNIEQAKSEIKKFIKFYNRQRLTPNEAYKCTGTLRRVWKTYRRKVTDSGNLEKA